MSKKRLVPRPVVDSKESPRREYLIAESRYEAFFNPRCRRLGLLDPLWLSGSQNEEGSESPIVILRIAHYSTIFGLAQI